MTVGELIVYLQALPPDLPVLLPYGDDGYEEVGAIWTGHFLRDVRARSGYSGQHDSAEEDDPKAEPCVFVSREG